MIIIGIFIVILVILIIFVSIRALKDKEEFEAENVIGNNKKNKIKHVPEKHVEIINEIKFENLLAEARKDPEKLELLKKRIQDTLRKSVKEKNITGARTCNMQLKKIDIADRKETEK